MSKFRSLVFRVDAPAALAEWYTNILGMSVSQISEDVYECGYPTQDLRLSLRKSAESSSNNSSGMSVYWKIGIGLEDVSLGQKRILAKGVQITEPHQFQEIGFLCHLKDGAGFSLELLQDTFEKNFVKPAEKPELPLGQPGKIGQITIRSSNIEKTLALYEKSLGMKMLSIQEVEQYGFTLYFLAFTDDCPPQSDNLHAVENREWLWQRDYTTLEIQYKAGFELSGLSPDYGVGGVYIKLDQDPTPLLKQNQIAYTEIPEKDGGAKLEIKDHDGFIVNVDF